MDQSTTTLPQGRQIMFNQLLQLLTPLNISLGKPLMTQISQMIAKLVEEMTSSLMTTTTMRMKKSSTSLFRTTRCL